MSEYEIGKFVISKAGHDKGMLFVILKADEKYVYLADGKNRTNEKLKKKSKKHVCLLNYKEISFAEKTNKGEVIRNEEVKRAIKLYLMKGEK